MCTVSMIGDHYADKFKPWVSLPDTGLPRGFTVVSPSVSREEFDQLKRDVEEMKALLKRAKKYDEDNGEPDCELEDKMKLLRQIAKLVGVSLDDVIGPEPA